MGDVPARIDRSLEGSSGDVCVWSYKLSKFYNVFGWALNTVIKAQSECRTNDSVC